MLISDFVQGLEIFSKHARSTAQLGGAEHDVIFVVRTIDLKTLLSVKEVDKLLALGFFYDEEDECWSHFV